MFIKSGKGSAALIMDIRVGHKRVTLNHKNYKSFIVKYCWNLIFNAF